MPTLSSSVVEWLESVIAAESRKTGDINFIFCDDEHLLKVNQEFLQHDYYTDIITFDYGRGNVINADIFISLQRIQENAGKFKASIEQELLRVLVHGILHLCGYADKSETEQQLMRSKEDFYLYKIS